MAPRWPDQQNHSCSESVEVLGGEAVFAGTRVPLEALFDYVKAGDRLDDFLDDFPTVSRDQAIAAVRSRKRPLGGRECEYSLMNACQGNSQPIYRVTTLKP